MGESLSTFLPSLYLLDLKITAKSFIILAMKKFLLFLSLTLPAIFFFLKGVNSTAVQAPSSANPNINVPLQYFGYAAISCEHDDPFDGVAKIDYSDEVAGFTNLNQVCITGDMEVLKQRLQYTSKLYTPAFYIEPILFEFNFLKGTLHKDKDILWAMTSQTIKESGINTENLVFYLADEPTLRNLPMSDVVTAARMIKSDFPKSKIMVIEAYKEPIIPIIPSEIDIWGFNAYTILDPTKDQGYVDYLNLASSKLKSHQSLSLIMDGQHTPIHLRAGLKEGDMAEVAYNYLALAKSRTDISAVMVYTWAGGIDNNEEKGVRDLPQNVIEAHKIIGRNILENTPKRL